MRFKRRMSSTSKTAIRSQHPPIELPTSLQHVAEPLGGDVVAGHAEQEAIEQPPRASSSGRRLLAVMTISSGNARVSRPRRKIRSLSTISRLLRIALLAFSNSSRKTSEASGNMPSVLVTSRHREAGGCRTGRKARWVGEARKQIIEDAAVDSPGEVLHQRTFGRAGRAEKEKVLARHEPNAQQIDDFIFADESRFHRGEDFGGKAAAEFQVVGGHDEWFGVRTQFSVRITQFQVRSAQ